MIAGLHAILVFLTAKVKNVAWRKIYGVLEAQG